MRKQSGATLMVALIFLIVLTLLVLSGVNSGALGFRIATNLQSRQGATATAQAYLDSRVASPALFLAPPTVATTDTTSFPTYTITLLPPKCIAVVIAEASGSKSQVAPIATSNPTPEYLWDLTAIAADNVTGAQSEVHEGVKIRLPLGTLCPN